MFLLVLPLLTAGATDYLLLALRVLTAGAAGGSELPRVPLAGVNGCSEPPRVLTAGVTNIVQAELMFLGRSASRQSKNVAGAAQQTAPPRADRRRAFGPKMLV